MTTQVSYPCELCGELTISKLGVCCRPSNPGCKKEYFRRWGALRDNSTRLTQKQEYNRKNLARNMVWKARVRAKKDGYPCDISWEDIVIPEYCPILGVKLESGIGTVCNTSPTLDKIIPEKGYIKGNIQVISSKANLVKNDATPEEMLMFAEWAFKTFGDKVDNTT
jgi:hypothetical protein